MTRAEYEAMDLDELLEWANENISDLTSEEVLVQFAKEKIDNNDLNMAMHILDAIYNSEEAYHGYYRYDYSMGTLETPTPITCKEDLDDLIFFDDEEDIEEIPREWEENRKTSNRLLEMVEDHVIRPYDAVLMCLKWMGEDEVEAMCKANEIFSEEEDDN